MKHTKHILALSWRDIGHKRAGGAEVYSHALYKRLVDKGWRVTHIACHDDTCATREVIDGVTYIRRGGFVGTILWARRFYRSLTHKPSIVIDQCNTHRYFTPLWLPRHQKRVFFIHQFTREIWFYEQITALPLLNRPLQLLGYLLEVPATWLYRWTPTMTVCDSTRDELASYGIHDTTIIPEGKDFDAWVEDAWQPKNPHPTFIYVGRYMPYKQVDHVVRGFLHLLRNHPDGRLLLLGKSDNSYVTRVIRPLLDTDAKREAVIFTGFVSEEDKLLLMSQSHALIYASDREGWGIPVIEAACVGTPSIVYDAPGLRDAVDHGRAGILLREKSPEKIASAMEHLISHPALYEKVRRDAYRFSSQLHWDHTGDAGDAFLNEILTRAH